MDDSARDHARCLAGLAFSLLARAVNHRDDPGTPYRFTDHDQARLRQLCGQLALLIEHGTIVTRGSRATESDVAFQRFIGRSMHAVALNPDE